MKVNGFHIELGEIRKVLADHPSVVLAALAVHNNTLGAYLVLKRVPQIQTQNQTMYLNPTNPILMVSSMS